MPRGSPVYFVLCSLLNGEEGVMAVPAGGGDDPPQADGWYYLIGGEADGHGPYPSREAALRAWEQEEPRG